MPALPSGAPLLSHSLSRRVHTSTVSSTRANRGDRLLACAASHRSGSRSRSPKERTIPCSLSPRSPCLPEIPTEGRALEGKPAQMCRALRKLTANQATQTQPAGSQRGEATLGSRSVGLAQTHHVGRRDISTLARETRETRGEAHPSTAWKEEPRSRLGQAWATCHSVWFTRHLEGADSRPPARTPVGAIECVLGVPGGCKTNLS